jgi:hypothetical protein
MANRLGPTRVFLPGVTPALAHDLMRRRFSRSENGPNRPPEQDHETREPDECESARYYRGVPSRRNRIITSTK